jgi:hypothetical protein
MEHKRAKSSGTENTKKKLSHLPLVTHKNIYRHRDFCWFGCIYDGNRRTAAATDEKIIYENEIIIN